MEPVISPWVVWGVGRLDAIATLIITGAVSGTLLIPAAGWFAWMCWVDDGENQEMAACRAAQLWRWLRKAIAVWACVVAAAVVTPNTKQMCAIIVAQYVTTDRLDKAVSLGEEAIKQLRPDVLELLAPAGKKGKGND